MSATTLLIVNRPFSYGSGKLPLISILEEAVREILRNLPERGAWDAEPDIEGLAHLVRVLMIAGTIGEEDYHVVGFFRLQIEYLQSLMKEYPGDVAGACRRLGSIFAEALRLMGREDSETHPVPEEFRVPLN